MSTPTPWPRRARQPQRDVARAGQRKRRNHARLRQVRASFDAAQRALHRRGQQRDFSLSLGLRARHVLNPKPRHGDA